MVRPVPENRRDTAESVAITPATPHDIAKELARQHFKDHPTDASGCVRLTKDALIAILEVAARMAGANRSKP